MINTYNAQREIFAQHNGVTTSFPTNGGRRAKKDVFEWMRQNANQLAPDLDPLLLDDPNAPLKSNTIVYGFDTLGHYRYLALAGSMPRYCERPAGCPNYPVDLPDDPKKIFMPHLKRKGI